MLRIIVDSNILISGLFFDKNPEKLLLLGIDGKIRIILLDSVISEVDEKIKEKFSTKENLGIAKDFWFIIQKAFRETEDDIVCERTEDINCRDDDDQEILRHASQMQPDYFISGDSDVLDIEDPPLPIIGLRKFLETEFPEVL